MLWELVVRLTAWSICSSSSGFIEGNDGKELILHFSVCISGLKG